MGAKQVMTPLVVVVGRTASGKSGVAMEVARKFNGEIICADSRTVYKNMDIGTAKPSKNDQAEIRHHILDVVDVDSRYSASEFKSTAFKKILEISKRGKLPIIVGGTGLYVDGVLYDLKFKRKNQQEIQKLEDLTDTELVEKAKNLGLSEHQVDFNNRRHLIGIIARGGLNKQNKILRGNTLFLGLNIQEDELRKRIKSRLQSMIDNGLEVEVKILAQKHGWKAPGMQTICYREWQDYFEQREQKIEELIKKIEYSTWQYSKRQRTWYRGNPDINWIDDTDDTVRLVEQFLIQ